MSNIDFSRMVTAEAKAEAARVAALAARKAECRARIFAVADETAQDNLNGAATAGLLTEDQMTTYRDGLIWIAAMRAACYTDEDWPDVPAGVAELAAKF